jgi:hypothetical protein
MLAPALARCQSSSSSHLYLVIPAAPHCDYLAEQGVTVTDNYSTNSTAEIQFRAVVLSK